MLNDTNFQEGCNGDAARHLRKVVDLSIISTKDLRAFCEFKAEVHMDRNR